MTSAGDPVDVAVIVARILDELDIRYVVGGAVAASIHGEPRATEDLDVLADITTADVDRLVAKLEPDFYVPVDAMRRAVAERSSFNVIHRPSVRKVDIFVAGENAAHHAELQRGRAIEVSADPALHLRVATAEDVVLQKLLWFEKGGRVSDRQWRDVLGILKVQADRLDWSYLSEWALRLGCEGLLRSARRESGLQDLD